MDFEKCCEVLQKKGIVATKFNYSNDRKKPVIIKVAPNRKSLTYQIKHDQSAGCLARLFTRRKTVKISSLIGMLFGGTTTVFETAKGSGLLSNSRRVSV